MRGPPAIPARIDAVERGDAIGADRLRSAQEGLAFHVRRPGTARLLEPGIDPLRIGAGAAFDQGGLPGRRKHRGARAETAEVRSARRPMRGKDDGSFVVMLIFVDTILTSPWCLAGERCQCPHRNQPSPAVVLPHRRTGMAQEDAPSQS